MQSGASTHAPRFFPANDAILRAFEAHATSAPDRPLVRSTTWRVTTGEIDVWSRAIAATLAGRELGAGDIVALVAPNGPAFLAAFLGLRRAGCVALLIDDGLPADDQSRITNTIGARAVLDCRMPAGQRDLRWNVAPAAGAVRYADAGRWAAIKMTSGSTGMPRGVAASSVALMADEAALARTMGITTDDIILAAIPMSHSYGFTTLALAAIIRGVPLVIPADDGPLAPLVAAAETGATVFPTVPAYVQAVLRTARPDPWPRSLRLVITAGAPLARATATRYREINGRGIHVFYGSSECGGICYDRTGRAGERGTVGTPVDGVTLSFRPGDADDGSLLVVESAAAGETYVPDPDARLIAGRFETADIGAWQDGEIVLRRRTDRVINVRSFKVDPVEVEQVLAGLPDVDDVLVLGVAGPDGPDTMVRAVIACRGGSLTAAAITAWCRARLADHKIPRSIVFVDALPRTPRGKIDVAAVTAIPVPNSRQRSGHV